MAEPWANVKKRSEEYAWLKYRPALREIQRRTGEAGRQYKWGKRELEPEYQRYVNEQKYNLGQQLSANQLARENTIQDYDIAGRSLGQTLADQRRRTEMDMARRGLWQSGVLNKANMGLSQKYMQSLGDIERQRTSRLSDYERQGLLARSKSQFNISDAQRSRIDQLKKIYEAYSGELGDLARSRGQLAEEKGISASQNYQDLMDQYRDFALKAKQLQGSQALAETQFHHEAYWAQQKFDEDKRRYGVDIAMKLMQMKSGGGGGGGGYGYSSYGNDTGTPSETPLTPDEQADYEAYMDERYRELVAAKRNTMGPGNPVGKSSYR